MSSLMAVGLVCGVLATVVSLMPRLLLMEWTALARFLLFACAVFVVGAVGVCVVSLFTSHHRCVESVHRNK
jgi:uncharacterized membrane protein